MYSPADSSLTRQAWSYQQKLIDEMGMAQLPDPRSAVDQAKAAASGAISEIGIDRSYLVTCGTGFLAAGFAGYVAGKIGVVPTAVGVGLAYLILKGSEG